MNRQNLNLILGSQELRQTTIDAKNCANLSSASANASSQHELKMPSFLIGLICTPLMGLFGCVLVVGTHLLKLRISSGGDFLAALLFGSLMAAPTTLVGLPLLAVRAAAHDPSRRLRLALGGLILGWLTMFAWLLILVVIPGLLGSGSRGFATMVDFVSAIALIGAFCGGLSGAAFAIFANDAPRVPPIDSSS